MGVISITRGRPKTPESIKKLTGTSRKDRANPRAPAPAPIKMPAPPKGLNRYELEAWKQLAKLIDPLRVAAPADLVAFRQMVITVATIEQARDELAAAGGDLTYEVTTEAGVSIRKRPELEIILQFKKQLSIDLSRFGLTPADRARVSQLGDEKTHDALDEFSNGP